MRRFFASLSLVATPCLCSAQAPGRFPPESLMLRLNEELFRSSSGMLVFRGNINLMKADTTAAEAAFREAIRRDRSNQEAKGRLQAIGKQP